MEIITDLSLILNKNHHQLFNSQAKEIHFYGGAGAGKSYSVVQKILLYPLLLNQKMRTVVVRRSFPSLTRSAIPLFKEQAENLKLPLKYVKQEQKAIYADGSEIYFLSMNHPNDYEKVKSLTDLNFLWVEEATELSEQAYEEYLRLRLRGQKGSFSQIILTYNPSYKNHWLYKNYFLNPSREVEKIHVNVLDNPYIDENYKAQLLQLSSYNKELFKMYYNGDWADLEGDLFSSEQFLFYNPFTFCDFGDDIKYAYLDWGFTGGDKTVVLCGAQALNGMIYIENVGRFSGKPDEIVLALKDFLVTNSVDAVYAEANFRQGEDVDKLEDALRLAGFKGGVFKVYQRLNKEQRIRLAQPLLKYCRFREDYKDLADYSDFLHELKLYGNNEGRLKADIHDDDADAFSGFLDLFDNYGVLKPKKAQDSDFSIEEELPLSHKKGGLFSENLFLKRY